MTEKPISFTAPMVRAILDGSKTMTRRVVKPQPCDWVEAVSYSEYQGCWAFHGYEGGMMTSTSDFNGQPLLKCPYGSKGTKLWIREEWRTTKDQDHLKPSNCCIASTIQYRSDMSTQIPGDTTKDEDFGKWRRSRFIPRAFSRIYPRLRITDIRLERAQDISEADAIAEGVYSLNSQSKGLETVPYYRSAFSARKLFSMLWDSINSKRPGCPWADSPWVWVVEFERI